MIDERGNLLAIDPIYLRRHYASLSDEGLLEVDETELVDEARRIYDEELAQRGLTGEEQTEDEEVDAEPATDDEGFDMGPEPDWLKDADCPATFVNYPGGEAAQHAAAARAALEAAGIPVHVSSGEVGAGQEAEPPKQYEFRVMVPGRWLLEAESVLDQEI